MSKADDKQRAAEWHELYKRVKSVLEPFGEDDEAGGDYYVADFVPVEKVQMVEMHRLHMLRPEIVKSLHGLLSDFPDWQIEVFMINPEEKVIIDPEHGLILRKHEIIDALEREYLPAEYRFHYEGSRPAPKDFKLEP